MPLAAVALASAVLGNGAMNGYTGGNMNGKYSVWSGSPNAAFEDDYAAQGYEYFDVWAPEIATYYGQVFWTDQGNVPLPPDIVERFKGKVMAIQGYEQDQVMVTPVGKPGVNPDQDVSVPINWAYNHHYMAWMTGAHSEIRSVDAAEAGEDYYGNGAHGKKTMLKAFDLPSAKDRADPSIPTSQMFSEGNGGESRKSYHGYPPGYAQLIESPESWHITPMQIDTRNRDCGVGPEAISNCTRFTPGPEPRQSRYGRGIPEGTNYSGILECPCNGGYGGSPQFYKDHPEAGNNTKSVDHQYSAIGGGVCTATSHILDASECFDALAAVGFTATKVNNISIADATKPQGCFVVSNSDGSATATFNTAGTTPCPSSTSKLASLSSVIGVTAQMEMTQSSTKIMARSQKGVFCGSNHDGILASFSANTASNVTALDAALTQCEAYCLSNPACTACSVDLVSPASGPKYDRWVAIPACGAQQSWTGAIPGDISLKTAPGNVTITMSGPADGWFGIGFNAVVMSDSPYTLVVNSTTVWEQKIGTCGSEAEHCPGDTLAPSIKVLSSSVANGVRTVKITRAMGGLSKNHYSFSDATPTINYIVAIGSSQAFGYHKAHSQTTATFMSPAGTPTCLCDLGAEGELCQNGGTNCGKFVKNCVAAPAGSLLAQQNPTCNSRQYVGGLSCCHHGRIMLDEDQNPGTGPLLRYHMKFRFWFQEYKNDTGNGNPSHYDLPRIYYQTEANAGEYDIPPAFSLPGNPVAGYPNWPLNKMTPGTSCTGTCPDGPDCECIHTITYHWTMSNQRIVYAGGHCHAPACISIELYKNDTGTPELICRQLPLYGSGNVDNDKYDEAGYLALPPCLFKKGEPGLIPGIWIPENTPMFSVKKNRNTDMGHYGEMASWQMRGVNFPEK